ncbi:MAG: bifunctional methylenetetrahydrofolate dehydrogenase/methenyltetrahydrofolate cyclohydrolase FolD [Chlamydiales bacterium]|nr:bifunctional methylenetetrahydrofolate dehydrogenase/methenyltetrahydrofolate cyclohydrolase FolD [Chlamydiales bacterium]
MLIDGALIAKQIQQKITEAIRGLKGRPPGLAFLLVGDNPSSKSYIRMKKEKCSEVGIASFDKEFPTSIPERVLLQEIHTLNCNPDVDGILVQLPLPAHLNTHDILHAIDPRKDVDGFHPLNVGKMLLGEHGGFLPCTPLGIHVLLNHSQIPLLGKHVVIVGRSNIVGKPLSAILMQKEPNCNATVTVANSLTENLQEICLTADILVAAIGKPRFIKKSMVKKGAAVIDVGINRDPQNPEKIVGDVDFNEVATIASAITPVPKGVGPMTIAMLLSNTLLSYQRHNS